jgi:predicted secreted protein
VVLLVVVLLVVVLLQAPLARVVVLVAAVVGGVSLIPARVMLLAVAEELESLHDLSFLCGDTSPERRTLVNRPRHPVRFPNVGVSPR